LFEDGEFYCLVEVADVERLVWGDDFCHGDVDGAKSPRFSVANSSRGTLTHRDVGCKSERTRSQVGRYSHANSGYSLCRRVRNLGLAGYRRCCLLLPLKTSQKKRNTPNFGSSQRIAMCQRYPNALYHACGLSEILKSVSCETYAGGHGGNFQIHLSGLNFAIMALPGESTPDEPTRQYVLFPWIHNMKEIPTTWAKRGLHE
jgi:hypothetical protein